MPRRYTQKIYCREVCSSYNSSGFDNSFFVVSTVGDSAVLVINKSCSDWATACRDYRVAKQCDIVDHCLDVWSQPVATVSIYFYEFFCFVV